MATCGLSEYCRNIWTFNVLEASYSLAGRYVLNDPLFNFEKMVKVATPAIEHKTIKIVTVAVGKLGTVCH